MSSIRTWLEQQGLAEFVGAFEAERVDLDTLPDLTDADLKEIGLPLGPRRRLLKAVRAWQDPARAPAGERRDVVPDDGAGRAERRQLTVLFCDLVGSMALSAALDPEDTRQVVLRYQDACAGVIARFEGFLARFMGDGVMAMFGAPFAFEGLLRLPACPRGRGGARRAGRTRAHAHGGRTHGTER